MLFGSERSAANNIITRKIMGHSIESQGLTTLNLFSGEDIQELAHIA